VLVDGDDFNEPVADAARSILDGHVVLTRKLAQGGHYPAIDVLDSKSRVRDHLLDATERQAANRLLRAEAAYREKEDLIMVGAYQKGSDLFVDAAVQLREQMLGFVQQRPDESTPYAETRARLGALASRIEAATTRRSA
jgi:flagellar biosynthesis/type III secretory pathway ATPase